MSDDAPADHTYRLFSTDGSAQFRWRLTDEGVRVGPKALAAIRAGHWTELAFADVAEIRLNASSPGRALIGQCTLTRYNGLRLIVSNAGANGQRDTSRDRDYRAFVTELHRQLLISGAATSISFRSGFSAARQNGLLIAMVAAALLFVGVPLVLLLMGAGWQVLLPAVVGVSLFYPAFQVVRRNQPSSYDPAHPPDFVD